MTSETAERPLIKFILFILSALIWIGLPTLIRSL